MTHPKTLKSSQVGSLKFKRVGWWSEQTIAALVWKKEWERLAVKESPKYRKIAIRDALLEIVPAIVASYGNAAVVLASHFYESEHIAALGMPYKTTLAVVVGRDQIEASVRYAAGFLYVDKFQSTKDTLTGQIGMYVRKAAGDTIIKNAIEENKKGGRK
jgi:hypothetical protein